nr:tetratricopeptide repeat protein [uncultured Rhodoferax sp.]
MAKQKAANVAAQAKALFVEAVQWVEHEELGKADAALDRHLQLAPGSWPGLCLKAMLAAQLQRHAIAENIWAQLLKARPDYADGYCQLGLICEATGRLQEAVAHFQRALALNPAARGAGNGLATVYQKMGRFAEAMALYQQVLRAEPDSLQTQFAIATLHQAQNHMHDAVAAYRQVLQRDPHHLLAGSNLLFCEHYLPERDGASRLQSALAIAQQYRVPVAPVANTPAGAGGAERPLRVGVVSADLRRHPVGYFLEAVFHHVGEHAWQWVVFSNSADGHGDELTARLRPHCTAWHDIANVSDAAVVQCITKADIDVLIDLSGHTAGNRLAVFAARAAPVQVSWLGYFATTALSTMDYVLADPHSVPESESGFFTETVWRLPHTRLCFAPPHGAPNVSAMPAQSGRAFTFGCFQALAKINTTVLQTWNRILAGAPKARLRIQSVGLDYPEQRTAFETRLVQAGLPLDRITLHGTSTRADYLQAYAEVDAVLDTFPYPGGTTTVEALWMGVPTLTLATPGMLGRQGAALLTAVGLPEWVCNTVDAYVQRAVDLATDASSLQIDLVLLRKQLRGKVQISPLMDARRFASDLYAALRSMAAGSNKKEQRTIPAPR